MYINWWCLDGSVPNIYYRPGTGNGINKFSIYEQGGGWCASINNCVERTNTFLGSTKYDEPYSSIDSGAPYLSSEKSINPLSYNWNTIYYIQDVVLVH